MSLLLLCLRVILLHTSWVSCVLHCASQAKGGYTVWSSLMWLLKKSFLASSASLRTGRTSYACAAKAEAIYMRLAFNMRQQGCRHVRQAPGSKGLSSLPLCGGGVSDAHRLYYHRCHLY